MGHFQYYVVEICLGPNHVKLKLPMKQLQLESEINFEYQPVAGLPD